MLDKRVDKGPECGAFCVTAFIDGEDVVVSNLGNCKAVLCGDGVAETLAPPHNVYNFDERKRIVDKGGFIGFSGRDWLFNDTFLYSRSIGFASLKDWMIAEPDTNVLKFTSDMEVLVLATDTFWDWVRDQEAVDTVKWFLALETIGTSRSSSGKHPGYWKESKELVELLAKKSADSAELMAACMVLSKLAMRRGDLKDISVMIIDLSRCRSASDRFNPAGWVNETVKKFFSGQI